MWWRYRTVGLHAQTTRLAIRVQLVDRQRRVWQSWLQVTLLSVSNVEMRAGVEVLSDPGYSTKRPIFPRFVLAARGGVYHWFEPQMRGELVEAKESRQMPRQVSRGKNVQEKARFWLGASTPGDHQEF